MIPGPPIVTTSAYPPGGVTALDPNPVGTPTWAWPPITAMRAEVSTASGSMSSFFSSTMP